MLSSKFTAPDIQEQAKLDRIARAMCPICLASLEEDGEKMKCSVKNCLFTIPAFQYVAIRRQYGQKEDN